MFSRVCLSNYWSMNKRQRLRVAGRQATCQFHKKGALLHFAWVRRDGGKRPGPPTTSESVGHCGRPGPPAGRARFLAARAPCRARFSPVSAHGPAGLGTVSVHDVAGAYTAQRALRRFPYTARHGGGDRTLYTGGHVRAGLCTLAFSGRAALHTGDPVPRGLCTLGTPSTVQTPSGIHPPVRKVPLPPPDVALLRRPRTSRTPSEDPHKVQKPLKRALLHFA